MSGSRELGVCITTKIRQTKVPKTPPAIIHSHRRSLSHQQCLNPDISFRLELDPSYWLKRLLISFLCFLSKSIGLIHTPSSRDICMNRTKSNAAAARPERPSTPTTKYINGYVFLSVELGYDYNCHLNDACRSCALGC